MSAISYSQYFESKIAEVVHLRGVESTTDLTGGEIVTLHQVFESYLNDVIKTEHAKQYGQAKEISHEI